MMPTRIIIIGDGSSATMSDIDLRMLERSSAATTGIQAVNVAPEIPCMAVESKKRRGKYWDSPKYQFRGQKCGYSP